MSSSSSLGYARVEADGWGHRLLLSKMQDEVKALQLCQTKIRQKKLPMEVIDAEYQWCVDLLRPSCSPLYIILF